MRTKKYKIKRNLKNRTNKNIIKRKYYKNQKGGTKNNLHILMRNATNDLIDVLNSIQDLKWFFIEGTLLSVLRYGDTFGKIGNRLNLVDGDIDVMIIVKNQSDWLNKSRLISDELKKKRWNCNGNYINTHITDPAFKGAKNISRNDKVTCYYHTKSHYSITPWTDIHSLIDDGTNNLYVHEEDLLNNVSNWPFKNYGGSITRDIIYPLRNTFYNGKKVTIPNKFIELLLNWNNSEYSSGCVLFPYPIKSKHEWYNYFRDYLESNLTEEELKGIVKYSVNLNNKGLPSLYDFTHGEKYNKCLNDYKKSL